jgi:MazG family protein
MHDTKKYSENLAAFVKTIAALRTPGTGCPWDLEQTHQTLRPYLLEETYEVLAAIDSASDVELREELGDLLLQIVIHCQLATERSAFTFGDITEAANKKMIERHPHVFGDVTATSSAEVLKNWEKIKAEKKGSKESMFADIPAAMPALLKAQRVGEKASRVNFDWDSAAEVFLKVTEELDEFKKECSKISLTLDKPLNSQPIDRDPELQKRMEDEFGDLLFSLVQYGRWIGCNAEDSLRGACNRFMTRFGNMEKASDRPLKDQSRERLEELWNEAKITLG